MLKASRARFGLAAGLAVLASAAALPAGAGATSPAVVLTRWAGTGGSGYNLPTDRLSANINYPESIVMDSVGNIYVAEDGGYEVAKITPDGHTTRFAGDGTYPNNTPLTAGPPVAATSVAIKNVHALAIDASDNLYIGNGPGQVLKVTPSGQLTLLAGAGSTAGSFTSGGPAVAAPLGSVYGLVVDASGNVYISDPANGVVEEVTVSNGDIHVVAGQFGSRGSTTVGQSATSTMMTGPAGLALDGSGDLYINDSWQGEIFELNSGTGTLTLVAGGGANQPSPSQQDATSVQLNSPQGLKRDSAGNLYVVDYGTYELMKVTPDGKLSVLAGTGSAAPGPVTFGQSPTSTALSFPYDVLPLTNGTMLLADGGNSTIDRIGFNVPGPPTAVSVAPSESGGQLTFTPPTDPGSSAVTGYEASFDNGATWVPLTTTVNPDGSLSAPVSSLVDGTSYPLLVHAVNASGAGSAGSGSPFVPGETPVLSVAASISGTPAVGTVLSAVPGTWVGGATTLSYQWLRDGHPISGATASTYTPVAGDAGHVISVTETATNAFGDASATSNTVSVPVPAPAVPVTVPVSLGTVPLAGIAVSDQGQVMLTLVCPPTPTGCDASGVLIIHLPASLLAHAAMVAEQTDSAATGTVLARFSGQQIAGGHSALIAVQLNASVLRQLQTLRIRRVKVTLTISNHLTGGPAVSTTDVLYLRIPPLRAGACPVPTGQVTATDVGPVTLGATRTRERHLLPDYTARNPHTDNFCLYAGSGIRVGYASAKLLGSVVAADHEAVIGRSVLALTANPYYTIDGIRHGTPLTTAAKHLHLAPAIHAGRNHWYIVPGPTSNVVLKVRHGVIKEIGIATKALTTTRSAQRSLLSNF